MSDARQNGKSATSMDYVLARMFQDPEFLKEQDEKRSMVQKLITETVPDDQKDKYCIKIVDIDLKDMEVVAVNDDGSDGEVVKNNFSNIAYFPIDIINRDYLPIDFFGNVEISIVKIAEDGAVL